MKFNPRKSIWKEIALAAAVLGLLAGCATTAPVDHGVRIHDAQYYLANPMSQRDLSRQLGRPLSVMDLDQGLAQWIYPLPRGAVTGYRYFLVRKGQVLFSGVWITDVSG